MYDAEYFQAIEREEGPFASRLASYLSKLPGVRVVVDLGCGPGTYTRALRAAGVDCRGTDSSPCVPEGPEFKHVDLASVDYREWVAGVGADLCLCLEVFEHVDLSLADEAVRAACATAPLILLSAAHPGQGGAGHVNCQPKSYWLEKFCRRGFYYCPEETEAVVAYARSGYHMGWFTMNAMMLRRAGSR
jgi:hypothetical protein